MCAEQQLIHCLTDLAFRLCLLFFKPINQLCLDPYERFFGEQRLTEYACEQLYGRCAFVGRA
ncbi:hypothetical protein D3C78_1863330 [compost metagenome]